MTTLQTTQQSSWDRIKADMKSVQIDGDEIRYLDIGPRDAPAVIFMNGALLTVDFWKYQVPVFAQHFRTVAYDYRERGRRANTSEGFMEDLRDIIAKLDLAPVIVIASSMGGMSAQRFAAQHPDQLRALVMCSSFPRFPQRLLVNVGRFATYIVPPSLLARRSKTLVAGDRDPELGELFLRTVSSLSRQTVRNRYNILRTSRTHDVLPRIHGVPVYVISGGLDEDVPVENGKYLADHIEGADFDVLAGGGHLAYFECHDEFNSMVLDWLARKGLMPLHTARS